MAAKRFQDLVKGKITNSNVTSIRFSSNNGQQEKSTVNISNVHPLFEERDSQYKQIEADIGILNFQHEKLQSNFDLIEEDNLSTQTPTYSKSSPDSKQKFGTYLTDVEKNINKVEDLYSGNNSVVKDEMTKSYPNDQDSSSVIEKPVIRGSKTMSNLDKVISMDDVVNENTIMNKSLDNLSVDNDTATKTQADVDAADCKSLLTSKNSKRNKIKSFSPTAEIYFPAKIQESLIENFKFPDSKIAPSPDFDFKTKWPIFAGLFILLLILVVTNLQLFIGFGIGLITCLWCLSHFGILDLKSNNRIISLPALKDLHSPEIPHIQKDNFEDRDIHASDDSCFSGWINVLFNYEMNNYNINHCHVVHASIEHGNQLRIKRPKRKILRRAMWNESQYQLVPFISEIVISLENVKIDLLPPGLVRKRLWSKKYPISIELSKPLSEYSIEKLNFEVYNPTSNLIYLFGRTGREKEEWFRRLSYACNNPSVDLNMWNIVENYLTRKRNSMEDSAVQNSSSRSNDNGSRKSFTTSQTDEESRKVTYHHSTKEEDDNQEPSIEAFKWKQENKIPRLAEYVKYMSKFMPADLFLLASEVMSLDVNYVTCNPEILCLNAFLGRMFWDFLRGPHWVKVIQNKIQCKLKKMHLPQFIDQLTVVDIHFGKEIPLIRRFSRPYLDSRGLWCDAEIAYTGGFYMILETKLNLFNLRNQMKKSSVDEPSVKPVSPEFNSELNKDDEDRKSRSRSMKSQTYKKAAFASSEEDSAESSSDSDESGEESKLCENVWLDDKQTNQLVTTSNQAGGGGGSSRRIIRWVDKIARSSYFIKAADNKYIQRGMEIVSNTKLMLQVEVHSVCGTLALNIPPPPSDRLWFGFRPSPILRMSAKPKVGQKEISISKITEFIEKKLTLEFQKVLVLPNMDDIPLPLLINGNVENYRSNL